MRDNKYDSFWNEFFDEDYTTRRTRRNKQPSDTQNVSGIQFIEHWKPLVKAIDFSKNPITTLLSKEYLWKPNFNPNSKVTYHRDVYGIVIETDDIPQMISFSEVFINNINLNDIDKVYESLMNKGLIYFPTYEY